MRCLPIAGTLLACLTGCDLAAQALVDAAIGDLDRLGHDPGKPLYAPRSFVNWETPHVSPLDLTPDGTRLLAVNTPDNRLEVFDVAGATAVPVRSIPVGLDPVSVRARTPHEVWVVNHISDSISIVDLDRGCVVDTLTVGDEPTDVAFAGGRALVVCSQINEVQVYTLDDLARDPVRIPIAGEDPRAIALSPDGRTAYVAVFESGNGTTILPPEIVGLPESPYGGMNPVPALSDPAASAAQAAPGAPPVSLIVRKDRATGQWLDDNGANWAPLVTWDLLDHDVAAIDTQTLEVRYIRGLMNLNMHLAVRGDGMLTVVGTDADNQVRFEPRIAGRFVRALLALVDPARPESPLVLDLNPHLAGAYASGTTTLPPHERRQSLADPRGIVWTPDGQTAFVSGMGSNSVILIDARGQRVAQIDVGQGPTGLRLDEARGRLYVLNRFEASISVVDLASRTELARLRMFDPTPAEIRQGRPFLYDAHRTSGLGVTACGACHVDARMDQLAWDLGDPTAAPKPFDQRCDRVLSGLALLDLDCEDFHPLKGPMTTQTLQGIIGLEPLHWRGDRSGLAQFNPAFVGLNGSDRQLSDEEMRSFEAFLATIQFPPNPHRNLDNSLRQHLLGGNPQRGREVFFSSEIDAPEPRAIGLVGPLDTAVRRHGGILACGRCHVPPAGTNQLITPAGFLDEPQSLKVPHLRNLYEKTGFDSRDSLSNRRGFGFAHDGSFPTLVDFLHFDRFLFDDQEDPEQARRDLAAFLLSFSTDTHPAVGVQVTLRQPLSAVAAVPPAPESPRELAELSRLDPAAAIGFLLWLADSGDVGLVVHGHYQGEPRGLAYRGGGVFQTDRASQQLTVEQLCAAAAPGSEQTWTIVPLGSETRIGIDRDSDGILDGDELPAGTP